MPDLHEENLEELGKQFFSRERSIDLTAEKYTKEELCAFLREHCARLEGIVREMTPAQVAYRVPGAPKGWDASGDEEHFDTSQIVTHVAVGTSFYWWGIARAMGHDRPQFPRPPSGAKVTGTQGRVVGRGGWSGIAATELVRMLHETTEDFLAYVEGLPPDAEGKTSSYGSFGDLTLKGWLLLLAVHFHMHLKQIEGMRAQPDYPAA
jgi:hypothetical protein